MEKYMAASRERVEPQPSFYNSLLVLQCFLRLDEGFDEEDGVQNDQDDEFTY